MYLVPRAYYFSVNSIPNEKGQVNNIEEKK